ncbi:hydroxymethylbilane synthase [Clostridium fallax]|uniref:Porphobilinogen deaminase n=1 Tax=Clostridium fallax TaxID=1533 RepID=A0A1M4VXS0_9CLOT|nr:hydroxymethylbilane synthase [Clostridium fallax]SHE73653.1 hydroxymethylbilane synthase [Clostridium fallax]SQB07743.1 porphobilinogen deaminase [Clostridium fallax]
MNFKVATRKSILAQVQADHIINLMKNQFGIEGEKLLITTEGDKRLDVALNKIGGKGLFVKDIELALIEKKAHCAVHSMKDVPYEIEDIFEIGAIPNREDVRDAFISREGMKISDIKKGAKIGTSSIRRALQLKELVKDIEIVPIRGNVQTRLKKMEEQKLDGIILAAAGLNRLNMNHIITDYFDPMKFIPAIGQGALAIEILKNNEEAKIVKNLDNKDVRIQVECERSFMKALKGGCHSLIGAYSILEGNDIYMIGTFQVGDRIITKDIRGNKDEHIMLGESLAEKILKA